MQELRTAVITPTLKALPNKTGVALTQRLIWVPVMLISLLLRRNRSVHISTTDIKSGTRYVIASSHGSMYDPFLILQNLPIGAFLKLTPVRFFAHNGLFTWWLKPFLLALGCFPSNQHARYPSGLDAAASFVDAGQTLLIFPEGKRYRGEKLKPRKGVAVLASMPNVEIIPVKITWNRGLIWGYDIVIGKPQNWAGRTADAILFDILTLE